MARRKSSINPQEVFNYLTAKKGVSEFHAKGMIANIKNESAFRPGAIGDQGTSGGFFQHHNERFSALKRFAPDWKTNWKGQVDYALTEPDTQRYLKKKFRTPRQASMWFTEKWERPADAKNKARQRAKDVNLAGYDFGDYDSLGFDVVDAGSQPLSTTPPPQPMADIAPTTSPAGDSFYEDLGFVEESASPSTDDSFYADLGFAEEPTAAPINPIVAQVEQLVPEMPIEPVAPEGIDLGDTANMYAQATAPAAIQPDEFVEPNVQQVSKYEQLGSEFDEYRETMPESVMPPGRYGNMLAQQELAENPVEFTPEPVPTPEDFAVNPSKAYYTGAPIIAENRQRERQAKGERTILGKTVGDALSTTDTFWQKGLSALGVNLGKDTPTFAAKLGKSVEDARQQTLATARNENPDAIEQIKTVYEAFKNNPNETIKELGSEIVDHLPSMLVTRKISMGALKRLGKLTKMGAKPTPARKLLTKEKFGSRLKKEALADMPSDVLAGAALKESEGGRYGLSDALTDAATGAVMALPIAGAGHLSGLKVKKIKNLEHLKGFKKLSKEQFDKIENLVVTKDMEKNPKVLEMIPQFLDMADSPNIQKKIIGFDDSNPTKYWDKQELKKAGYGDREPGWFTSAGKTDKGGITLFKKADASTVMEEITHHLQDVAKKDFPEIQKQIKTWENSVRKLARDEGRKIPDGDELFAKVFSAKMGHGDKFPENITTIPIPEKLVTSFGDLLKKEAPEVTEIKAPKRKKESKWLLDEDEVEVPVTPLKKEVKSVSSKPEVPPEVKAKVVVPEKRKPDLVTSESQPKPVIKKKPAPKSILEEIGETYKYENLDKAFPDGPTKKQIIKYLFEKEGIRVPREEASIIRRQLEAGRKTEANITKKATQDKFEEKGIKGEEAEVLEKFRLDEDDIPDDAVRYQLKPDDDAPIDLPPEYIRHGKKKRTIKDVKEKIGSNVGKLRQLAEDTAVPLSTKIGKRSKKVALRVAKYDWDTKEVSKGYLEPMISTLEKMEKMPKIDSRRLDLALQNGNVKIRDAYLKRYGLGDDFKKTIAAKDRIKADAEEMGIEIGNVDNHWPRQVDDVDGLLKHLNNNNPQSFLLRALKQKKKDLGRELSLEEREIVANQYLQGIKPKGLSKPGNIKERKIETLTPEMAKYYKSSVESMTNYVDTMTRYMAQRKFFGKNSIKDADGVKVDVESSIGALIADEATSGRLKAGDEVELTKALQAYFNPSNMNKTFAKFKTLGYLSTLGSVFNTVTQFTDLPYSIRKNGIKSFLQTAFAKKKFKLEDINVEHIAEELSGSDKLSKITNKVFKINMFKMVDRWSKETFTGSAMKTAQRQAKANDPKLNNKLEFMFEGRAGQVKQDILDGTLNKDTKFFAFQELAGVQPISLLEVPQQYLKSGNLRIMYMLKTFAIKQFDVLRQDLIVNVMDEYQAGNKLQAAKNFTKLSGFVGSLVAAGMTKDVVTDWMSGKEIDMDDAVLDNVLKLLFVSKYAARTFREDGIAAGVAGLTFPPFKTMEAGIKDLYKVSEGKFTPKDAQVIESIPVVGEIFSRHIGRKAEKRKAKRRKKLGL